MKKRIFNLMKLKLNQSSQLLLTMTQNALIWINGPIGLVLETQREILEMTMKYWMSIWIWTGYFYLTNIIKLWIYLFSLIFFSYCDKPIYIEAREVETKKDWTGSESILLHQVQNTTRWAYGVSKDFGFVWNGTKM